MFQSDLDAGFQPVGHLLRDAAFAAGPLAQQLVGTAHHAAQANMGQAQ
jgi:hypothetical protein